MGVYYRTMIQKIALIASIALPLWNIPLIYRIIQRKSSKDVSLAWTLGVWSCLGLMVPSGILSKDLVWKVYTLTNFTLFNGVLIAVLFYRKKD
jgi:uncharacterized protein with PQ loop repeat